MWASGRKRYQKKYSAGAPCEQQAKRSAVTLLTFAGMQRIRFHAQVEVLLPASGQDSPNLSSMMYMAPSVPAVLHRECRDAANVGLSHRMNPFAR